MGENVSDRLILRLRARGVRRVFAYPEPGVCIAACGADPQALRLLAASAPRARGLDAEEEILNQLERS